MIGSELGGLAGRRVAERTALLAAFFVPTLLAPGVVSAQGPVPEPEAALPESSAPPAAEMRSEVRPAHGVRHGIGLRTGVRMTSAREDLLVPLTFSGAGLALGVTYQGRIGPGTLSTQLELGLSLVANRFGHLGLTLDHALTVGYLLPVYSAGAWRFHAGGIVGESSDSLALESWDDAHGYWLGMTWLGAGGSATGPLGARWQLEATMQLALLGTAGRPEEFRRNKQDPTQDVSFYLFHTQANPRFFAPWDVQLLRFDVAARRGRVPSGEVGRGWAFGCQGRFARASFPQTIIVLESVIYAAWTWGI